ncbi:MAG: hypothetical protein ACOYLV_10535 [Rubrivivax sp.]
MRKPMGHGMGRLERALSILWPSFVTAGILETLLFAVVDPAALSWFGGEPMELSRQAVYTLTFLLLWGVIALGCSITALLLHEQDPD